MESRRSVCRGTRCVVWRTGNNRSAMLSQLARKSAYLFVYRGSVGAICRTRNNRDSILSPLGREPAIQKVPKYGMRDPHMLYKISCWVKKPVSVPANLYIAEVWVLFVGHKTIEAQFFSPPGRESAIQKVSKYGMRDPHMLYKISCPYFIKVHVYYVFLVCQNTFISLSRPYCTNFLI